MCQEPHPELYDFIAEARLYKEDESVEILLKRETDFPGRCVMIKPQLGDLLPVYVKDKYEEFSNVVPMIELPDAEIESYLRRNVEVLERVVEKEGITALHANHTVLMSVVAQRVAEKTGVEYAVMPHGSAIEFAVKKDPRFHRYAAGALAGAKNVVCIGDEIRSRLLKVFPDISGLEEKFLNLNLGVATSQFKPVDPSGRGKNIDEVVKAIAPLERGKTPQHCADFIAGLREDIGKDEFKELCDKTYCYDGKKTDADLETRLKAEDWSKGDNLLFVGRLIATKGPQGVIAALPEILEKRPETRLIVVGHGPLREPLEALVYALSKGWRGLAERIVDESADFEGSEGGSWETVSRYWAQLRSRGKLARYFNIASKTLDPSKVIFTGYLTHNELKWLFPVCDVGLFPSVVPEAGPLVFLEAMASGVFPCGTYFAGMKASIDSIASEFPDKDVELMKLSADAARTTADIAGHVAAALELNGVHRAALNAVARDRYDWTSVAQRLSSSFGVLPRRG
jgi:glycosyltransferase involved in cell wall biosynthesis